MKRSLARLGFAVAAVSASVWVGARGVAQGGYPAVLEQGVQGVQGGLLHLTAYRGGDSKSAGPRYRIQANVDYDLLTFNSTENLDVPVARGDTLRDVVCFIYANSAGVGGDDARHKNVVVDRVALDDAPVRFNLDGAVLRITLPRPLSEPFSLRIDTHGVVPRSPPGSGTIMDMMGGMSSDLGDMGDIDGMLAQLGLGDEGGAAPAKPAPQAKPKPKNIDYGLYTYGNGILSLGSFWYPSLAVRQNGRWDDEAPEGLGDLAYADMSDFDVTLRVPRGVTVASPGHQVASAAGYHAVANNVREFAVLMSEDYQVRAKTAEVGGKPVTIEAYTLKTDTAKVNQALDIAAHALQIYANRFGPYAYDNFKIAEGPIRGGAGGMEFSGMTAIASLLYQDLNKQMGQLAGSLGAGNLDKVMQGFEDDGGAPGAAPAGPQAAPAPEADAGVADAGGGAANPANDMLKNLLGQQQQIFTSLFETTIAHEVAHQWWAISVGSDSQRAPFVDESLANYSAMVYYEDRYGPRVAQQMTDLHLRTTYSMGRMMGSPDAPVNLRTSAYQNNIQYGAIVYGKGALYYGALRQAVGDRAFFDALREYYTTYAGRLAGPHAFVDILARRAPAARVGAIYARWIEGTHGDDDINGGKVMDINDMLGGLLGGGALGGGDQ